MLIPFLIKIFRRVNIILTNVKRCHVRGVTIDKPLPEQPHTCHTSGVQLLKTISSIEFTIISGHKWLKVFF